MARRIVLLRAVNVGGAKLPMAELREVAEELGATDVSTYIASGNLLCTPPGDPQDFDRALEQAVEKRFGFFREVISRSADELRASLDAFPFDVHEPKLCYLNPLTEAPTAEGIEALRAKDVGPDEWKIDGAEMWLRYADGMAGTKLTPALIKRCLGVHGTARNLNTVRKLLELAEAE
ncbi:MAG: DUF1697 domain-containing protein [Aeromicrobium erythreum]